MSAIYHTQILVILSDMTSTYLNTRTNRSSSYLAIVLTGDYTIKCPTDYYLIFMLSSISGAIGGKLLEIVFIIHVTKLTISIVYPSM